MIGTAERIEQRQTTLLVGADHLAMMLLFQGCSHPASINEKDIDVDLHRLVDINNLLSGELKLVS